MRERERKIINYVDLMQVTRIVKAARGEKKIFGLEIGK